MCTVGRNGVRDGAMRNRLLARLHAEVASLAPVEINDSTETAPSKRLNRLIPGYSKTQHGPDVIERAGLTHVRSRCPRFDYWLTRLEMEMF